MDRLSDVTGKAPLLVLLGWLCGGCPSPPKDGPPPAESVGIAAAAPRALGALAAGTDAAPRALTTPGGALKTDPDEALPDPDGEDPDAGTGSPDAGAAPEDLPL